ncbi:hypothetical protein ILYODFUR_026055 [Ilyodon furcidens]|uniref:Uncharacterized protein n=1 Tax=Ilyodon furcidens TaxID=33524 RepID=A0ABV0UN72_9TELE
MSLTNSSAYRSERSFHQTSSSTSSSCNPYMEKSRGLFTEDFGSFIRPGSDALGFSSHRGAGAYLQQSLDCGRKPEYPERTHACTERTRQFQAGICTQDPFVPQWSPLIQ